MKCAEKTEVWARVCGFFRPVSQWNQGKKAEYGERTPYKMLTKDVNQNGDPQAD